MAIIKQIKDSNDAIHDIIDTKNTTGVCIYSGDEYIYLVGACNPSESEDDYENTYTIQSIKASADGTLHSSIFKTAGGEITISDNGISAPTITTSGLITANGGITSSGTITTTRGISAGSISSTGLITANGGITSSGTITTTRDISAGSISSTGIITAQAFYESSDERLKTFTEDYDIDLGYIKNIKTGKFYWNEDDTQTISGGVSAQTVEQYFPELVRENDKGFKTVNYDGLAVVAIAAIKKLTERVEQLEDIIRNK
jgi:hypothetical protein